jgi:predicted amidohydrolase YtcJ
VKFWTDGSNQLATAAQTKPYLNKQTRGSEVYTPGEMQTICQKAKTGGWTILAHCQGDASLDEYLNAMEAVYGAHPASGLNRVEHATMARQDQIDRMKKLGCEPSFMPDFIYLYGNAYRDTLFGPERGNFMIPFGAAAKAGIGFSLHSDNPAAGMPMSPLRLIQTAVTRRCVADGSIIGPELCLTVDQAIRGVTQYAARHLGLGDEIGTIEKGKEADLTILESDPYTTDAEKLSAIKVSETWVSGQKKFG